MVGSERRNTIATRVCHKPNNVQALALVANCAPDLAVRADKQEPSLHTATGVASVLAISTTC